MNCPYEIFHIRISEIRDNKSSIDDLIKQLSKRGDHVFNLRKHIRVIEFDVVDDDAVRFEREEMFRVFVAFDHDEIAVSDSDISKFESRDFRSDDDGRIHSGFFKNESEHRRRRAFAVRARDDDHLLIRKPFAEKLEVCHLAYTAPPRFFTLGIRRRNRGRIHEQIAIGRDVRRRMPDRDGEAHLRQNLRLFIRRNI